MCVCPSVCLSKDFLRTRSSYNRHIASSINLAAARIWRREGQVTDCGGGFTLQLGCALIRDRPVQICKQVTSIILVHYTCFIIPEVF